MKSRLLARITSPWRRAGALRSFSTEHGPLDPLVQTLLRNPELSPDDAANEARWIRQEARANVQRQGAMMLGLTAPSQADVEALIGLESGVIMGLVERRAKGEPLQYVLGNVDFGPLNLICRPPTLIPRPETAHISLRLAEMISKSSTPASKPLQLLDLCSGSGCIPLLISHELGTRLDRAIGIDISTKAIRLATENADLLEMANVKFIQNDIMGENAPSEILSGIQSKVGIVTANPPYISKTDWEALPDSVKRYEDSRALLGDVEGQSGRGLTFYHRIAELLSDLLLNEEEMVESGWSGLPRVMLEVGETQGPEVMAILATAGEGLLARTDIWEDQFGKHRAVVGWTRWP